MHTCRVTRWMQIAHCKMPGVFSFIRPRTSDDLRKKIDNIYVQLLSLMPRLPV